MTHRRNEFSSPTKRAAFKRSNGVCECHRIPHVFKVFCGLSLGEGNTFYEHIDPDKISGRNDLDNVAVLTRNCWRYKTSHYDKPVIARTERVRDGHINAKGVSPRALIGGRFTDIKIKVRGGAVDRRTGVTLRAGSRERQPPHWMRR